MTKPGPERPRKGDGGFALAEILVAISILSIGLLGLGTAMAVQSGGLSAGISTGHAAVNRGYYVTTAMMLAQERMEDVKRLQWTLNPAVDQLGAGAPAAFPNEAMGSIAGYSGFSREVNVQNYPGGVNMKTITVTVTFRLPTVVGTQTESVAVTTVVSARP